MVTKKHTAAPAAPVSAARQNGVSTSDDGDYFAQFTSPAEIAKLLLEHLEEGVEAKGRAHSVALGGSVLCDKSPDRHVVPRDLFNNIGDILEDHAWAYALEDGLKRIIELSGAAPASPTTYRTSTPSAPLSAASRTEPLETPADYANYYFKSLMEDGPESVALAGIAGDVRRQFGEDSSTHDCFVEALETQIFRLARQVNTGVGITVPADAFNEATGDRLPSAIAVLDLLAHEHIDTSGLHQDTLQSVAILVQTLIREAQDCLVYPQGKREEWRAK